MELSKEDILLNSYGNWLLLHNVKITSSNTVAQSVIDFLASEYWKQCQNEHWQNAKSAISDYLKAHPLIILDDSNQLAGWSGADSLNAAIQRRADRDIEKMGITIEDLQCGPIEPLQLVMGSQQYMKNKEYYDKIFAPTTPNPAFDNPAHTMVITRAPNAIEPDRIPPTRRERREAERKAAKNKFKK